MAWEQVDPWRESIQPLLNTPETKIAMIFFYSRPLQQTLLRNSLNEYFAWILMYHVSWRTAKNTKYEPERYSDCKLTKGSCQKKQRFFWEIFPKCGWVGWLFPKQGPNPSKPPQITPKIAFFDPNFTFRFPKSHKNPVVGEWVHTFGKTFPNKTVFLRLP